MKHLIIILVLLLPISTFAQTGIGTTTPDPSAQLEVSSTSKGFLPPRMTTEQRDAIVSPATGLVIYNTTTNILEYKIASGWVSLIGNPDGVNAGEMQYWDGTSWLTTLPGTEGQVLAFKNGVPVWIDIITLSIQDRLNIGETPIQIYESGIPLDSLYGKSYQGGLIANLEINPFELLKYGKALIVATTDQSSGILFLPDIHDFENVDLPRLDNDLRLPLDNGLLNTDYIIAFTGESGSSITSYYAAGLCRNYTGGGYTDWFLPSVDQVRMMRFNLFDRGFGSFLEDFFEGDDPWNNFYWTSSYMGDGFSFMYNIVNANYGGANVSTKVRVRAVREF